MNLESRYVQDIDTGNNFAPITTPNAVRFSDGTDLNDNLNALEPHLNITASSGTTLMAATGNYYRFDAAVGTLSITLPEVSSNTIDGLIIMLTTNTTPAITFASSGTTPAPIYTDANYNIQASKSYEINAIYNGAAWIVAAVEIVVPEVEEEEGGE